ncbi:MAG: hypothetical protein HOI23_00835 [Deltaproteobacteria bacterium]|nr:hypothetical protein [Deltaproteobacteria bacterium]MBT6435524.1 hypothetical protein [Deltaproteobacteria bacterium]MBT6491222.1 hypothetical protein [Deltaproteobacteria bacterium]
MALETQDLPSETSWSVHEVSIPVRKSTYKGGKHLGFHRWFRLTPSFGPHLVQHLLGKLGATGKSIVLDPFCGAGTTPIECKRQGLEAYGIEINPILQFVGQQSLMWQHNPESLRIALGRLKRRFQKSRRRLKGLSFEEAKLEMPPIHRVERWWRKDVLKDLLILKQSISSGRLAQEGERDFFKLALAAVLVPDLTNVTLGRLQLHFVDRDHDEINVWKTFEERVQLMIADLDELEPEKRVTKQKVYRADSTKLDPQDYDWRADLVITSPPYPNRYSYVWNTRPHLYMLDYITAKNEAGILDNQTVGGTWGAATTRLKKGVIEPAYPIIDLLISPLAERIRETDNLMANYLMKYFNLLARQLIAMDPLLRNKAKIAYVVGNSWLKGVYIETDTLLARLFEGLGYGVDGVERFRRRNSGKDLFESIVYAHKV